MEEISTNLIENESLIDKLTKKSREATQYDFDSIELSKDIENALTILDPELIEEVSKEEYNLENYYREHLSKRYKGCKEMTINQIMTFQKEMISKPLLKIPSSLEDLSIQIFKNLLSYMEVRKSSKKPYLHIIKFIKITMTSPEELKDEAFIQVIKQLSNNDNVKYENKAWNFLSILCSSYPPSVDLYKCLINFFLKIINDENEKEELKKKANYCSIRLMRTFENKRKLAPSIDEIKYIESMKSIIINVYFLSGASTSILVESYTTIRELKTLVIRKIKFKITRIPYFAIYEFCEKKDRIEQRYLDESTIIGDILSLWARETNFYNNENIEIQFKLYLKIHIFYPFNSEDIDSVSMIYMQTNFEVLSGKFPLTEGEIIELGGISLFINYPYNDDEEELMIILKKEIKNYIPINIFTLYSIEKWSKKLIGVYLNLEYKNKNEAKFGYLEYLKDNIMYEAYQFPCYFSSKYNNETSNSKNLKNPEHIPEKCIIAVKPKEVIITDIYRNEILKIPFSIIASWGVNTELIVIVVRKNEKDFSKYYFECRQNKLFRILMESYSNIISGKSMSEIIQMNEETCRMFEGLPTIKLEKGQTLRSIQSSIYHKYT